MMYMQIEEREKIVRLSPGTFHNLVVMQEHGLKKKKRTWVQQLKLMRDIDKKLRERIVSWKLRKGSVARKRTWLIVQS